MLDRGNADQDSNSDSRGYDPYGQSSLLLKPMLYDRGIGNPSNGPYSHSCDDTEKDVELPPGFDETA
jgi:hypothetical protein